MSDRARDFVQFGRFLHDTVAQDLAHLSFLVEKLNLAESGSQSPDTTQARDVLQHCCRNIRLVMGLLTPPAKGVRFDLWVSDFAAFLRKETRLEVDLSIDPVPRDAPDSAELLLATIVHAWLARSALASAAQREMVRLRVLSDSIVLDLETSRSDSSDFAEGWSMGRRQAEASGGTFEARHDGQHAMLRLALPLPGTEKPV